MTQQKTLRTCLYLWVLCLLVACSQSEPDREQRQSSVELNKQGAEEVLTVSLTDLEVGIDNTAFRSLDGLRALNYELNNQGKMGIRRPAMREGDEVKLNLLFNYEGSQDAPLMAKDVSFVWKGTAGQGRFIMKPNTYTSIQLRRASTNTPIAHHSEEEKQTLLASNKKWYYCLVYKPETATLQDRSMTVINPAPTIYKRKSNDETASTEDISGTATQGRIDLGGYPFASPWVAFDMAKLLANPHLSPEDQKTKRYYLPKGQGLAPRGYFLMLSFQNQIAGNQGYQINKIKIKGTNVASAGTLLFTAPSASNLNSINYQVGQTDSSEWFYDFSQNQGAETLAHQTKGHYYFFWAMPTSVQSSATAQIKISVEGQATRGAGSASYTFPTYDLPPLADKANSGRTLLYTLKENQRGPEPISNDVYHPVDYVAYHNYISSEDAVRTGNVAEELSKDEWKKARGVSTKAFYESHSGNGHELRTKSWTPKANAVPNNRRWPTLTDWATVIPLVHSDRTRATKKNPAYENPFLESFVSQWWGLKHPSNSNLTKKVRRHRQDLTSEPTPSAKGTENGRAVYEMEGGKEIISFHTSEGAHFNMILGAEYILHSDGGRPNDVFYGRRFIGSHSLAGVRANGNPVNSADINDPSNFVGESAETAIARLFPENRLLSAWRYERKVQGSGVNKTMDIEIKFVLLGPARTSVTLEEIGTEAWWQGEEQAGHTRTLILRIPRFHNTFNAVPHLTTSYYKNNGVAFLIDETSVWHEDIPNFATNSSTDYYLKLSIDR